MTQSLTYKFLNVNEVILVKSKIAVSSLEFIES